MNIYSLHSRRNNPQLSVSFTIAAFHTPAPIHYVTFDRKLDATAQGVKEHLQILFHSASPFLPFSIHVDDVISFLFYGSEQQKLFRHKQTNKKKIHMLYFPIQCYYAIDSLRVTHAHLWVYATPLWSAQVVL